MSTGFEGDIEIRSGAIDPGPTGHLQTDDLGVSLTVGLVPALCRSIRADQHRTDRGIGSDPTESSSRHFQGSLHRPGIGSGSGHHFEFCSVGRCVGPETLWPYKVAEEVRSTSTTTNDPASSSSCAGQMTMRWSPARPAQRLSSRRDGPSASTSTLLPMKRWLRLSASAETAASNW